MVNEIVEAARSHFPPLIFVIITPMINRLFKALKAKACRLLPFFSLSLSLSLYKKKRRIVPRFVQLFRETCVVEKPNLSLDNLIVSREQKRADIKYHVERRQTWETMG